MTTNEWRHVFATRLKKKMNEKGMTQTELAAMSGLTRATINHYLFEVDFFGSFRLQFWVLLQSIHIGLEVYMLQVYL